MKCKLFQFLHWDFSQSYRARFLLVEGQKGRGLSNSCSQSTLNEHWICLSNKLNFPETIVFSWVLVAKHYSYPCSWDLFSLSPAFPFQKRRGLRFYRTGSSSPWLWLTPASICSSQSQNQAENLLLIWWYKCLYDRFKCLPWHCLVL